MIKKTFTVLIIILICISNSFAKNEESKKDSVLAEVVSGLQFRNIGPAFCSGRIADFAVNPSNHSEYYI